MLFFFLPLSIFSSFFPYTFQLIVESQRERERDVFLRNSFSQLTFPKDRIRVVHSMLRLSYSMTYTSLLSRGFQISLCHHRQFSTSNHSHTKLPLPIGMPVGTVVLQNNLRLYSDLVEKSVMSHHSVSCMLGLILFLL